MNHKDPDNALMRESLVIITTKANSTKRVS